MPKQPPVEQFRVTTFVPKQLLGEVMASLTRIGLNDVSFDLVTDVPRFAQNVTTDHSTKAADFLSEWVKEHPTFRAKDAVKAFEADGRASGGCYSALAALVREKALVKLGPGEYSRADVKHLPAPKKTGKAKSGKAGKKQSQSVNKYDITNAAFIMRAARRSGGRFNLTALKKLFEADKRFPSSISPTINQMVRDKLAKRVEPGAYILLPKAAKDAAKKQHPAPSSLNGANAAGVAANG